MRQHWDAGFLDLAEPGFLVDNWKKDMCRGPHGQDHSLPCFPSSPFLGASMGVLIDCRCAPKTNITAFLIGSGCYSSIHIDRYVVTFPAAFKLYLYSNIWWLI